LHKLLPHKTRFLKDIAEDAIRSSIISNRSTLDKRMNIIDNLIQGEMSQGRDQLRELERIVREMREEAPEPPTTTSVRQKTTECSRLVAAATCVRISVRTRIYTLQNKNNKLGSKSLPPGNRRTRATLTDKGPQYTNKALHLPTLVTRLERLQFTTCFSVASKPSRLTARARTT
jgi:hypothetical protein